MIDRIRAGEEIPLEEFTGARTRSPARSSSTAACSSSTWPASRARSRIPVTAALAARRARQRRPMTVAEKIFARHLGDRRLEGRGRRAVGRAGRRGLLPHRHPLQPRVRHPHGRDLLRGEGRRRTRKVVDPDSILFFRDHLTFLSKVMSQERIEDGLLDVANQLEVKQRTFAEKQGIKLYGEQMGHRLGSRGDLPLEDPRGVRRARHAHHRAPTRTRPTPARSARGVRRRYHGDLQLVDHEGRARARCRSRSRWSSAGKPAANVTAKDYMLEILRHPYIRDGHAIGQIIEYAGPAVEALSRRRARHHDQHGRRGRRVHGDHRRRRTKSVEFLVERARHGPRPAPKRSSRACSPTRTRST